MDVLGSVLESLRLLGNLYCRAELGTPWGMEFPEAEGAIFHVFQRGGGWLRVEDQPPVPVASGDLVLFPRSCRHKLSDDPHRKTVRLAPLPRAAHSECKLIEAGGGGALSTLICGRLFFDVADENPLVAVLPSVIHLPAGGNGGWLDSTLRLLSTEAGSPTPGAAALSNRLCEIVFIQALRACFDQSSLSFEGGWLSALSDPLMGKALALMHGAPSRPWTLEILAKQIGMSRSSFAARFGERVGEPPLRYLTKLRMREAARALRREHRSVVEIGERVGYVSQAAFSKAFHREMGTSPAKYRRQQMGEEEGEARGRR